MLDVRSKRVNPHHLLRDLRQRPQSEAPIAVETSGIAEHALSSHGRLFFVLASAAVCLTAFGGVVVQANDDSGVMSFFRQNSRPVVRQAPPQYYAPQAFFPRTEPRRAPLAAAYAPYVGYAPINGIQLKEPRRRASDKRVRVASLAPLALPTPNRVRTTLPAGGLSVGRTAYCVRSCDGFFFPLSGAAMSGGGEEAACRRLCPTAEVKVYISQGSADIEDARSRDTGRRYAQMANALSYRKQVDASCTCSANGVGLTNLKDALKDPSLRRGDVVMTSKGMRVFAGGSFVGIEQASDLSAKSREQLLRIQNASLPGRSGYSSADVRNAQRQAELAASRRDTRTNSQPARETAELSKASMIANRLEGATIDGKRYVGPDLPANLR
jgi:hypothetical protein